MDNQLNQSATQGVRHVWLWILVIIFFTIMLFVDIYFLLHKHGSLFTQTGVTNTKSSGSSGDVKPFNAIAKVGNEYIYLNDLQTEIANTPGTDPDKKKIVTDKLIKDSIILQGGAEDKLITLDSSFYNNPNKDYFKRIGRIKSIESTITNQTNSISGTVVTIWFYNNEIAGPLGYDKSRELAKQKITDLYNKVKSGQMTIDQAVANNKNDTSLAQLDTAYFNNAGFTFSAATQKEPSMDAKFNDIIWQLPQGQLSPIVVISDTNLPNHASKEALYAFAQVKVKKNAPAYSSFDEWLASKTKLYPITLYEN